MDTELKEFAKKVDICKGGTAMTAECYYSLCKHHSKNEPFCHEDACHVKRGSELDKLLAESRAVQKKLWGLERKLEYLKEEIEKLQEG